MRMDLTQCYVRAMLKFCFVPLPIAESSLVKTDMGPVHCESIVIGVKKRVFETRPSAVVLDVNPIVITPLTRNGTN